MTNAAMNITTNTQTARDLVALNELYLSIAGKETLSLSQSAAGEMLKAGIIGLIRRDIDKARKDEDVSWFDLSCTKIETYTEQTDWRDNTGYLITGKEQERVAAFVAKWAATYLDPRDADGNSWIPSVGKVMNREGLFVRIKSYKISP